MAIMGNEIFAFRHWGVESLRGAPDVGGDELEGGKVVFRALVVAGGGASEVLDTVEEALDAFALPLKPA